MTRQQAVWASHHEWFVRMHAAQCAPGEFVVFVEGALFANYAKLRAWAGY